MNTLLTGNPLLVAVSPFLNLGVEPLARPVQGDLAPNMGHPPALKQDAFLSCVLGAGDGSARGGGSASISSRERSGGMNRSNAGKTAIVTGAASEPDQKTYYFASCGDSNSGSLPPSSPPAGGDSGNGANRPRGKKGTLKSHATDPILDRHAITMNARYHDGLVEFKKRCTDYETIREFITALFRSDEAGLSEKLKACSRVRVSDIGCGDGTITEHLARTLLGGCGCVQLDVIEPMDDYIAQTRIKLEPFTRKGLAVRYVKAKSEDHFSCAGAGQYDIVFASHSLHLAPVQMLSDIAASVTKGGYFIVVIGAKRSIMSILKDMFAPKPAITGADILQFMERTFTEGQFEAKVVSQPSHLDLRGIDLPERKTDLTETAKNILSLMIQKNADEISQDDYAKVRHHISARINGGILQLDNDCMIFRAARV